MDPVSSVVGGVNILGSLGPGKGLLGTALFGHAAPQVQVFGQTFTPPRSDVQAYNFIDNAMNANQQTQQAYAVARLNGYDLYEAWDYMLTLTALRGTTATDSNMKRAAEIFDTKYWPTLKPSYQSLLSNTQTVPTVKTAQGGISMGVISDLLFSDSAEKTGTQRTQAVEQQDQTDLSLGQKVQSVISSLLDKAEQAAIENLLATPEGQKLKQEFVATSASQYWNQYGPYVMVLLVVGLVVILFVKR